MLGGDPSRTVNKFVWDTCAILNLKEPDKDGYSPAYSFYKDFSDGWINQPYLNIFPTLGVFELNATISRKQRDGMKVLRNFYILNEHSILYDIDKNLIERNKELFAADGFEKLRGADLIFACIAYVEDAYLVTLDKGFQCVKDKIRIIDLNDSRDSATYRSLFT